MNEILIYDDIGAAFWGGVSAEHVMSQLPEGDVSIRVYSYGGDVFEGVAIYNALKRHKGKVTVYIDSVAASIASYIAMAADEVVIAKNASIMIHNPWTEMVGESGDFREAAENMDRIKADLVQGYVEKTGLDEATISVMMDATTWIGADEAVRLGFADRVGEAVEDGEAYVSNRAAGLLYKNCSSAPAAVLNRVRLSMAAEEVVVEVEEEVEEIVEEIEALVEELADSVDEEESDEATAEEVLKILADFKDVLEDEIEMARELIAAKATREQVYARVRTVVKSKSKGGCVVKNKIQSGQDSREKFIKGAADAITFKATGGRHGTKNEFSSFSLYDLARESLRRGGAKMSAMTDKREIVGAAFSPMNGVSGITHTTSDFPSIIQTAFEIGVAREFAEMDQAFTEWTGEGSLSNFQEAQIAALGSFSNLALNVEGAEHKSGTFADRGQPMRLDTYGRLVGITRHAIINDQVDFFGKVPQRLAAASRRTIGQAVSSILTGNPKMADGKELFHADHGNLKTGAGSDLTLENLADAMAAMSIQADGDKNILGITPKYLIVSPALYLQAKTLVGQQLMLNASGFAAQTNPLAGMLTVIQDPNLGLSLSWFLAADPAQYDTVEVRYLDGNKTPYIETKDGWKVDGVEFKVRIDFGASALDYRGLYKGVGTAS